ncbi:MAG: hypothetical protein ACREPR_01530 [Brasilonema sp.]
MKPSRSLQLQEGFGSPTNRPKSINEVNLIMSNYSSMPSELQDGYVYLIHASGSTRYKAVKTFGRQSKYGNYVNRSFFTNEYLRGSVGGVSVAPPKEARNG